MCSPQPDSRFTTSTNVTMARARSITTSRARLSSLFLSRKPHLSKATAMATMATNTPINHRRVISSLTIAKLGEMHLPPASTNVPRSGARVFPACRATPSAPRPALGCFPSAVQLHPPRSRECSLLLARICDPCHTPGPALGCLIVATLHLLRKISEED